LAGCIGPIVPAISASPEGAFRRPSILAPKAARAIA